MCLFTACGGDDKDDDMPGGESSVVYIEPCFNWGASLEEVKAWMANNPYELQMDQYLLYYVKSDGTAAINYMFDGNIEGLYLSQVIYEAKDSGVLSSLISQTEKRYNTTLRKVQEGQYTAYLGNAVVGSKTNILVRDMAKLLQQNGYDIGEKRLYCWLRDNKYLTLSNMPMQRYSEMGLFFVDEGVHSENGEMASHFVTKVTPKGQQYFINKFLHN